MMAPASSIHPCLTACGGFSASLLEAFEQVQGSRYEYETEVLTFCMREHVPLRTLPITTVYENQNKGSHFHPLRDSALIMAVMLRDLGRFLLSSLSSAVVDVLLAWFLMDALRPLLLGENFARIAAATVGARLVSMLVNYTLENLLSQYDCLVVVEPDRAEQRMLQKHFGVDGSAGFYRIGKSGTLLRLKAE